MFPGHKVTEIYCMADDFCKKFTLQQENLVQDGLMTDISLQMRGQCYLFKLIRMSKWGI